MKCSFSILQILNQRWILNFLLWFKTITFDTDLERAFFLRRQNFIFFNLHCVGFFLNQSKNFKFTVGSKSVLKKRAFQTEYHIKFCRDLWLIPDIHRDCMVPVSHFRKVRGAFSVFRFRGVSVKNSCLWYVSLFDDNSAIYSVQTATFLILFTLCVDNKTFFKLIL